MRAIAILFAFTCATARTSAQLSDLHNPRERHLANVRQLTDGGENAEAYWSFDGKKIVYQHRGGDIKADQIFVMNADGSNKRMVSTGKGRCTCSYFLPGDKEIIFSSTHAYSPDVPVDPDRSNGYVWPIYPYMSIYRANADGSNMRPLLPTKVGPGIETGYNAESTVAPNGKRVIFTSTRDGDIELYTMKPNGTEVKRVTNRVGYDGGAYFSPNSKMIVWRATRFDSEAEKEDYKKLLAMGLVRPTKMEIWVANADGSNARQVTNNGKANFAPFFTPDGSKIIFASNLDDPRGRSFDLYLINLDGSGLERVTWGGQFDAFPMFSPDGKKLVWASNRHGTNNQTNVFVADWVP